MLFTIASKVITVAELHLLTLVWVENGTTSFHNEGNARQTALRPKIDKCKDFIKCKNLHYVSKAIVAGLVSVEYSEQDIPGACRLWKTDNGDQSNWQATDCDEQKVMAAYTRLGFETPIDQHSRPDYSLATFVSSVQDWWNQFMNMDVEEQKRWIGARKWEDVEDIWLGGYELVEDLLASGNSGDLFLRFVLFNFSRISRIATILS